VIAGLGHVGANLARRLADAGAEIAVTDIDPRKREFADSLGAAWLEPGDALEAECDIVSPCAVGGAISSSNIDRLRCRAICGAANNQLADDSLAETLASRGILCAPDFIANAGGLINVYREVNSFSSARAAELALGIETTMGEVLARADAAATTPLHAARELARERLDPQG